jgi:predicted lysophospholipase L1 biosynthesis ABC-type transport system permease subunit
MSQKHQEDLSHIRSMMERSSRFISLSGLSGVFAGAFALVGAIYVYQLFEKKGIEYFDGSQKMYSYDLIIELAFIALLILILALLSGIFFTLRKSKKFNLPVWTISTKKMLLNLAIPLLVGAVFCIALLYHQLFALIAPTTLLFYGLALINAEKYTFSDIKYLGICEIVLGCISLFYLGYGLIFWAVGFGILHILYGLIMFKKYK